ncbi:MAG: tRNA uridine-5-carboxymethylaminomethyl(34) synthesis enzyme MnmG [Clostridia bacterium]|nr:tRNA uridine-5-carboxymethylaminomethyl(34) synthesis enzyme MnmG [Clostridia bacterium]
MNSQNYDITDYEKNIENKEYTINDGESFDAVVVGAGHAGCEACLALARTGQKTLIINLVRDNIAFLPCNPSIGGTAKGHIVCEIDALGGQMGIEADKNTIQLRMLNMGKGPAVQSLRAQIDKTGYHRSMQKTLENQENLYIYDGECTEIVVENGELKAVKTADGKTFYTKAVVLTTGVYLNARTITGEIIKDSGPSGFPYAKGLTKSLIDIGFDVLRFKTGTPPRVDGNTIDYSKFTEQQGDTNIQTFSFLTKKANKNIRSCWLGYTSPATKDIIMNNLDKAPMYSGVITGEGPRYCPSIESKFVRFSDKDRHQIFLEPETLDDNTIYIQGMSTSMPMDIQHQMVESIEGMEKTKILKYAYAIEYDCIDPLNLYATLEFKKVKGIFCAGQINGTSGYEEAAGQGIVAGINASLYLQGKEQIVLKRDEAYIGVLIDDLTTKGTNEPYRMMTSRAEFRLILRQDNADQRLTEIGRKVGLVDDKRYNKFKRKMRNIEKLKTEIKQNLKPTKELKAFLESVGEKFPEHGATVESLIKRPAVTLEALNKALKLFKGYSREVVTAVEIDTKYSGYLARQQEQALQAKKLEEKKIPADFDYLKLDGLRLEAREKLNKIKPLSVGMASRISGVSPADITVLLMYLK